MAYDFSTIGSLKGGCLSDQRSDGAGHVTMVDGVPVVRVKADKLEVDGDITGTSFSGDGSQLTALNATELKVGRVSSAVVSGAYTGITGVGQLTSLEVLADILAAGGDLYMVTTSNKINVDQSAGTQFTFTLNNVEIARIKRVSSDSGQILIEQYSTGSTAAGYPGYSFIDDSTTGMYLSGSNQLGFTTAGAPRMIIDASGNVLIGGTTPRSVGSIISKFGVETASSGSERLMSIVNNQNADVEPIFMLGKTRGTVVGGTTIVQNGDTLGAVFFVGSDGATLVRAATIEAMVDGTPGTNDMPGRLVFKTTPDGASSSAERMRINADGAVLVGTTSVYHASNRLNIQAKSTAPSGYSSATNAIIAMDSGTNTNGVLNFIGGGSLGIAWSNSNGVYDGFLSYEAAARYMAFSTANAERMRIDSSGKVGIGTSSPGSKLTVSEAVSAISSPNYATQLNIHNSFDGGSRLLFSNAAASELSAILGGVESSGILPPVKKFAKLRESQI